MVLYLLVLAIGFYVGLKLVYQDIDDSESLSAEIEQSAPSKEESQNNSGPMQKTKAGTQKVQVATDSNSAAALALKKDIEVIKEMIGLENFLPQINSPENSQYQKRANKLKSNPNHYFEIMEENLNGTLFNDLQKQWMIKMCMQLDVARDKKVNLLEKEVKKTLTLSKKGTPTESSFTVLTAMEYFVQHADRDHLLTVARDVLENNSSKLAYNFIVVPIEGKYPDEANILKSEFEL